MGANAREFLNLRMAQQDYAELSPELRGRCQIDKVEITDIDYSNDELWCKLKSESSQAYKKLKAREYELRHKYGYTPENRPKSEADDNSHSPE